MRSRFVHFLYTLLFISFSSAALSENIKLIYAAPTVLPSSACYIAVLNNYFKEEGLDVGEKIFSSGRDALQALASGQAQFQSGAETPLVHSIVQGSDLVTIASISENHEAGFISRLDHGVSKPEELKGKKIATAAGTNSDYFMYELLKKYNLKTSDVQITNMKDPDMKIALINGDIDAYFSREPHLYYAKKELGDKAKVFEAGELYSGRQLVNMNRDYVLKNPETVRKIIRALLKAERFINEHPEDAKKLVSTKLKIEKKDLDDMWKDIIFKVELDKDLPAILNKIGIWSMSNSKKEGPLPDFKSHIYTDALSKERKTSVEIK